jgi:DNA-binding NarL/FixJ family response regulator
MNVAFIVTKALTVREQEVLNLLVAGFSAKEIAQQLRIAPRTVECHIDHLRTKTGTRNRAQMAAMAVGSGLVTLTASRKVDREETAQTVQIEPRLIG